MSSGMRETEPSARRGFSKSSAGPPVLTERSANSVISRRVSTSKGIRFSSLFFSSARMKSRRSSCAIWFAGEARSTMIASSYDSSHRNGYGSQPRHRQGVRAGTGEGWREGGARGASGGEAGGNGGGNPARGRRSVRRAHGSELARFDQRGVRGGGESFRAHRNSGEQRGGDARRSGPADEAGGLGCGAADKSFGHVLLHPAGAFPDAEGAVGTDCEYFVRGGGIGKCGAGELRGVEGRCDRPQQSDGAGTGITHDHRECHCA